MSRISEKWKKLEFYVYALLDNRYPGDYYVNGVYVPYKPFYIGKGKGDRVLHHYWYLTKSKSYFIEKQRNSIKASIIWKLKELGYPPMYQILFSNLSEEESLKIEESCIKELGRIDEKTGYLSNLTSGGEGTCCLSESKRKELGESRKGEKGSFYGHHHTEESKELNRQKHLGQIPWNKGVPRTEEVKEKLRKPRPSTTGDNNPSKRIEVREKIRETKLGEKNHNSKEWSIIDSETGELFNFKGGLKRWCKDHSITYEQLKGPKCRYKIFTKNE